MSGMYQQFETDPNTEQQGLYLDYGHFRIKVARAGGANKKYQKRLESLTRQYKRAIATDTMDPEIAQDILRKVYAETVVQAWEVKQGEDWVSGIEAKDGTLLPFTPENVALTFKSLQDLFRDVQEQSQSMALFRAALREELAGN